MAWLAGAATRGGGHDHAHNGLYYGALMGSPNPEHSEPIASTYQFRVFADREDTDEIPVTRPRRSGVALVAVVVVAALVLGVMALLLAL
jgi:hypothetical protein